MRAFYYDRLAEVWQYNLFPDRNGAGAQEIRVRWPMQQNTERAFRTWKTLVEQHGPLNTLIEGNLVFDFLPTLQSQRAMVRSATQQDAAFVEQMLQMALQGIAFNAEQYQKLSPDPHLQAYFNLMRADICLRARKGVEFRIYLERAFEGFAEEECLPGLAACALLEGDYYAAPFSSPLSLNLELMESTSANNELAWMLEEREGHLRGFDAEQALENYRDALDYYQENDCRRGLGQVAVRLAYLHARGGAYEAAVGEAQKAVEHFAAAGDQLGLQLGGVHLLLHKIGVNPFAIDRDLAASVGAWGKRSGSLSFVLGLGILCCRQYRYWLLRKADYQRALACVELADIIFDELGVPAKATQCQVDKALIHDLLGDRDTTLVYYEQASDKLFQMLADAHPLGGVVAQQLVFLTKATFRLYLSVRDGVGMQKCAVRLRELLDSPWLPTSGADQQDHLLKINTMLRGEAENTLRQASVLGPLYRGEQARANGQDDEAGDAFAEAWEEARHNPAEDDLPALVRVHQKRYAEAKDLYESYLRSALTKTEDPLEIRQQEWILEQGFQFYLNIECYPEARDCVQKIETARGKDWWKNNADPWSALNNYGEMYEGLGDHKLALEYYEAAISSFEERRSRLIKDELKSAFAGEKSLKHLYFRAAKIAMGLKGQEQDSFRYSERNKARALLDLVASGMHLNVAPRGENERFLQWRQLNKEMALYRGQLALERKKDSQNPDKIAQLTGRLDQTAHALEQLEGQLGQSGYEFFRNLQSGAQILSASEVAAHLQPDTLLIEYFLLEGVLLTWCISSEGLVYCGPTPMNVIDFVLQAKAFYVACSQREPWRKLSAELGLQLFGHLPEELLDRFGRLCIVPYGIMHLIPFSALTVRDELLVESFTIVTLPSASVLQYLEKDGIDLKKAKILAVGNPAKMSHQPLVLDAPLTLKPLPAAESEARAVGRMFTNSEVLVGAQATETRVTELIPGSDILHFATHAHFSEEHALASTIVLSNGEVLSIYELVGMKIDAALVVLSACQTGRGEITGGDEVMGLSRAFIQAGVPSLVVSLWPIEDAATGVLMQQFYTALYSGSGAAGALHKAQRSMRSTTEEQARLLKQALLKPNPAEPEQSSMARDLAEWNVARTSNDNWQHPYYWAAFVSIGRF